MPGKKIILMVTARLLAVWLLPASADSTQAECDMLRHGKRDAGDSGPCQFSQRQGYVTIRLKSGKVFELSPASKPQHFKDKDGKDVKLDAPDANSSTYIWDSKSIVVHWNGGSSQSSQPATGKTDSFETVCGVMVGGQDHSYRCEVVDHYKDGTKTSTTLRFPDQTLNMVWKSGKQVELHFEGMAARTVRYSDSEGEVDFVFEDKTYYYFSDKGRARMEVEHLHD
jgi:hypothetical protein